MNLSTGKPFQFEVPDERFARWEFQRNLFREGRGSPLLGNSLEEVIAMQECYLFPGFQELLKIFFKNDYTKELMTKILLGFGVNEPFIQKLLEDREYVGYVEPLFQGITGDGGRASKTLVIIYNETKKYFSL